MKMIDQVRLIKAARNYAYESGLYKDDEKLSVYFDTLCTLARTNGYPEFLCAVRDEVETRLNQCAGLENHSSRLAA